MRASLVIVLGGFAASGCAQISLERRVPNKPEPAPPKVSWTTPGDDAAILAAPFVALQARPGAAASPATPPETAVASHEVTEPAVAPNAPEPAVASKVFQVRPSPVIPPFEPIGDPPTTAAKTDAAQPSPALAEPSTTLASTPPLPTLPDAATPSTAPELTSPSPAPLMPSEPSPPADSIEATVLEAVSPPSPTAQPAPSLTPSPFDGWVAGNGQASRMVGRPVSRVGNDVITLPELTASVKARLAHLPQAAEPSRREVIALAKKTLTGMVVRSLVIQEARDVMGGPRQVAEAAGQYARSWEIQNGPTSPSNSTDPACEEFIVRSLAISLMVRQGVAGNLDAYLDELGHRRTVTSIMKESELMAAGKREAAAERNAR